MTFAEQVKTAVQAAESAADTEPVRRYRAVLDELAKGLADLGVGARIQPMRDPRSLALYLYPPHRPARGSHMLTFFLDGSAIVVPGESSKRLETPEALESWLIDFVKLPAFIESLHVLRELAEEPVEARLRTSTDLAYAKGDVIVAVSPSDQKRLAEAPVGTPVELEVERIDFPGNAPLTTPPSYVLLDSAGIPVELESVEVVAGDKLKIRGHRGEPA